jgi:hypothetical protein
MSVITLDLLLIFSLEIRPLFTKFLKNYLFLRNYKLSERRKRMHEPVVYFNFFIDC